MHEACHLRVTDTVVIDDTALIPITHPEQPQNFPPPFRLVSGFKRLYSLIDSSPPGHDAAPIFACPFWSFNPSAHKNCVFLQLRSIHDVRFHLRRRHMQKFYCARCLQVFDTEGEESHHARSIEGCSPSPERSPFLTHAQWLLLAKALRGGQVEAWSQIYDILFPGQPRPPSPYRDIMWDFFKFREFCASPFGFGVFQDVLYQLDNDHDGWSIANIASKITPDNLATAIDQSCNRRTNQRLASRIAGESALGSCSDSRWSGSTMVPAETPGPSDLSNFGGKNTCITINRVPM